MILINWELVLGPLWGHWEGESWLCAVARAVYCSCIFGPEGPQDCERGSYRGVGLSTYISYSYALGHVHKQPSLFTICSDKSHFIAPVPVCLTKTYCHFENTTTQQERKWDGKLVLFWIHKSLIAVSWRQSHFGQSTLHKKIYRSFDYQSDLLPVKKECSSTQQIGQDLSHSYQTLLCVQWAYLLMVLLDFEPFSFFPSAHIVFANSPRQEWLLSPQFSIFAVRKKKMAVNLTAARLSQRTGILMPDSSLRRAGAQL